MSAGSLVHMLTIAVATVMVAVSSSTRSTRERSLIDARPPPSQAVGSPSASAWMTNSVRVSSSWRG
jgi:hypothetical protein